MPNYPNLTFPIIMLLIGLMLTCIIIMLGVAKLAKFYLSMNMMRREVDTSLTGIATQLSKLQTIMAESIKEQRRTARLLADLCDLKRAEMTGEFEIIENPVINPAPADASAAEQQS